MLSNDSLLNEYPCFEFRNYRILFRHSNNIVVAIKSNNNETNPKHNPILAKAIADAQYEDVPKVSNQISIN